MILSRKIYPSQRERDPIHSRGLLASGRYHHHAFYFIVSVYARTARCFALYRVARTANLEPTAGAGTPGEPLRCAIRRSAPVSNSRPDCEDLVTAGKANHLGVRWRSFSRGASDDRGKISVETAIRKNSRQARSCRL